MINRMIVRDLGRADYQSVWRDMRTFTDERNEQTCDELWLVEHYPVYTQGQAGKPEHVLNTTHTPVIQTDRGGQVTYHGLGQLIAYPLIDVRRKKMTPKTLVSDLENAIILLLNIYNISAITKQGAPGVYLEKNGAKIAFIGLRFKKMCSYHGISLNINMDLKPFEQINPCGYANLKITQMAHFITDINVTSVKKNLLDCLLNRLNYSTINQF